MSGYPQVLKYFMWPWQVYFNNSCNVSASLLFDKLDRALQPAVFLLGFQNNTDPDRPAICIEPEKLEYMLEWFRDWKKKADEIYMNDPNARLLYTGPGMQEQMDLRRKAGSHREAISKVLNDSKEGGASIFFVSSAVVINNYSVYILLQLNREAYKVHTNLKKDKFDDRFPMKRSLPEACVQEFLREMERSLYQPDAGRDLDSRTTDELLREAAKLFMYSVSSKGENFDGLHGLFGACNSLSCLQYERKENLGQMIITYRDNPDVEYKIRLAEPFSIDDIRKVRKLLELSSDKIGVISDSAKVFGLGKIRESYDPSCENVFQIFFRGTHCWDLLHDGVTLMEMRFGLPGLRREVVLKDKFISDSKRIFQGITAAQSENLFELAVAAAKYGKGCLLVITPDAATEAERLKNQCICITHSPLTPELIEELSLIDGGIMADIDGIAYAYGVILDGEVKAKGDSSRGSRYNSALRYHENRSSQSPLMIVVVSDDGMVDIIPNLRPQIRHADITEMIGLLEKLSLEETYQFTPFGQVMRWFQKHRFYLTQSECDKINELKTIVAAKPKEGLTAWFVFDELFMPDPDMNDSYYL